MTWSAAGRQLVDESSISFDRVSSAFASCKVDTCAGSTVGMVLCPYRFEERYRSITSVLAPSSKVAYLGPGQRVKCIWGGFGLVEATLNLINAANTTGEAFGRFCLLSGS